MAGRNGRRIGNTKGARTKSGHARISVRQLADLRPSPENDQLYRPIDPADPEVQALAQSIRQHGLKEPLVVTIDGYVLSGHRRLVAAQLAGLTEVPCRIEAIRREDDVDQFVALLREYNRQRVKNFAERLREELVSVDAASAHRRLVEVRRDASEIELPALELADAKGRSRISEAKMPFLDRVRDVLEERRKFWPLSDRQIHYALLNDPPLRHASKRGSRYCNDSRSYSDLTDLLTRARLQGLIPFKAISDETRPVVTWQVYAEPGAFIRKEFERFLKNYWRDLMQSQPNHIEVLAEKNSVAPICKTVCSEYCVPMTSGRGYCSLPPRHAMAQRYRKSGKEKLVLLIVSDFDPDGEEIAHSFARSMRDDFEIADIHPIKVALTAEQVDEYELPEVMQAKSTSSNHAKFVSRHGDGVWELEALPPETLQEILDGAIRSVLDVELFERELEAERGDAAHLDGVRRTVLQTLREADLDVPGMEDEE